MHDIDEIIDNLSVLSSFCLAIPGLQPAALKPSTFRQAQCRLSPLSDVIILSMKLSHEEVEHIAKLARLELTEEEKVRYGGQLSAILGHVAELQKLDTSSIPPMTAVFAGNSNLRADQSRPSLATDALLKTAPAHEQEQFKIPPVFE